ncbi:Nitrite reductase [NAD(P)H] [Stieleria neptunia]|uniref:Nitrite reductase [NAD(P)H] n=1 Tax=Stieleria neptunia TaxID=2527979 RepID=A0A518I003_9BACT|nr:FAD-dependent oxidoreductase [Stieleria neptunia]QDV46347.1 Nitrite reductase [NAD(P)H] [Stieleria neptunia]
MVTALNAPLANRQQVGPTTAQRHTASQQRPRLVIVGGGMAGFGLCDRLVRSGVIQGYDVTVIGDEPLPAYDRVNLSTYFEGRSAEELLLAPRDWYQKHHIELVTGRRIERIDREQRMVFDQDGSLYPYDQLVLATGSHAFVPPIRGCDSEGVFVYRTIADLESIRDYCASRNVRRGGVIGGGLLGLEAAKILMDLGLSVSVIEMAPGLMPRQLDADAAGLLKRKIKSLGVDVQLVRRTESIAVVDEGIRIEFSNASDLHVDLLVVAAGVRPNDKLAEAAGLEIGPRRGVKVNACLQTSDPDIFAIGECASFNDHVFGLAAPCFRMADVLAQRLAGGDTTFNGADESAELKLMGVQVATLGTTIGEFAGGNVVTHHDESGYRKLLTERGRIVGASCVGPWDELPQVRQAIAKRARLWPWQRKRFLNTGSPWSPGGAMPVTDWPADAIVCSCLSVSKSTIVELIDDGKPDVEQIALACGASTACGSCRGLVGQLAGAATAEPVVVPGARTMMVASVLALLAGLAWWVVPPIPLTDSVQSSWRAVESIWRSDLGRQVSGFTLVGLTLLGLVFSLRKRLSWFHWGSYGFWRAAHGVLGTAVLLGVALHTGMRLGHNLNFLLAVCFLSAATLGAVAGITSSLESRASGNLGMWIRRWRPRLSRMHLWVTWPLPILIALHVLGFYWFSD